MPLTSKMGYSENTIVVTTISSQFVEAYNKNRRILDEITPQGHSEYNKPKNRINPQRGRD